MRAGFDPNGTPWKSGPGPEPPRTDADTTPRTREAVPGLRGPGRREMKYVLPSEAVAAALVDRIQPFTVPDPHAVDLPGHRYRLSSLYLDNASLDLYMDTVRGEKNRHKLRIRHYERAGSPAFFEVKSKVNDVVRKRRAAVLPEAVAELVRGGVPRRSQLVGRGTDQLANLLWFRDYMQACEAVPTLWVRYVREPRVGVSDDGVRITFDRTVSCSPVGTAGAIGRPEDWYPATDMPVILEIKFGETYPQWLGALVAEFNLIRTSVPKYVLSIDACRRRGLVRAGGGVRVVR